MMSVFLQEEKLLRIRQAKLEKGAAAVAEAVTTCKEPFTQDLYHDGSENDPHFSVGCIDPGICTSNA